MAGTGPIPKPDAQRVSERERVTVAVREGFPLVKPEPPKGLKAEVKNVWTRLWESPLARVWDPVMDGPLVERYAWTLHHWLNAQRQLKRLDDVVTIGSTGQPVLHPITTYVNTLEQRLAQIEKELGMTPMSRARLGLTIAETELTAAQLNANIKSRIGRKSE